MKERKNSYVYMSFHHTIKGATIHNKRFQEKHIEGFKRYNFSKKSIVIN
jgi:hypothetical protein